jgi:hypothetical protein
MALGRKHRRTLERIFEEPTRPDIAWADFEALVVALGGEWRKPGRTAGSRRRAILNDVKGLFHRPHPGPIMRKGSVEAARLFLRNAGIMRKEGKRTSEDA